MKKLVLTLVMMLALSTSANAATVGFVDYGQVIDQYPLATKYKKELEVKADSLKKYLEQKEGEMKNAKDTSTQRIVRETALKEVDKRQKEYVALKNVREKEVETKIKAAAERVRVSKKLEVMVKADTVVAGGINCTKEVVNLLK